MKALTSIAGFALVIMTIASCGKNDRLPYRPEIQRLSSDRITPEVLWSFGRISGVDLSPDQSTLVFGVTHFNIEENRGYRDLYLLSASGGPVRELTRTKANEYNESWRPDGEKIGYLSSASGSMQLWEIYPDGTGNRRISDVDGNITGFSYSPDMSRVLFTMEVKVKPTVNDIYPDLAKANARIIDDLMYRHWDQWIDTYSHIFVAEYRKGKLLNVKDIMEGEPWESPVRPFGGMEQIAWSPDGSKIVYTCRKKEGREYALSTNTDLYEYDLVTGTTRNLTEGMQGYDINPAFSSDGRWLAWESMERDGYEADKNRLMIKNLETGTIRDASAGFEQQVSSLAWDESGLWLWFVSGHQGTEEIYRLDITQGVIQRITDGTHDYGAVIPAGSFLVGVKRSMSKPDEIYRVDPVTGQSEEISFVNRDILSQVEMGRVESRWITTTDQKSMKVWVIYPPHFDPSKKYPALLYCQGGPQSMVSQFWSYRWNFQIMAANDYIVVAPNRRGLPGFGQEWLEQISGDYGGQNMRDYLSAIDSLAREPYVDETRLGAVGASYGGFSVYWLAGNHEKRFKAFIAHNGMFNFESEYLETEELWFPNWDLGGPFWNNTDSIVQKSYANSPHRFVQKWDTPILVVHGEKDYRVTVGQGIQAFNAARLLDLPARFLYFPEENHWVLSPQNGILWQRVFFEWLDQWLKPQ